MAGKPMPKMKPPREGAPPCPPKGPAPMPHAPQGKGRRGKRRRVREQKVRTGYGF